MKIVVLISAGAEWREVKPLFPKAKVKNLPYGESLDVEIEKWLVTLFHCGCGKIASAGSMQYVIDHYQPDLIVNLGTCGGLEGVVEQGDLILLEQTLVYDTVDLMGGFDISVRYASPLDLSWLAEPYPFPTRPDSSLPQTATCHPKRFPSSGRRAQFEGRPRRELGVCCVRLSSK